MKCSKCNGTGFISGFLHVCDGECFDCNGSGVIPDAKKSTLKYSKSFIDQFLMKGFFPESLNADKICAFAFIGHPTAEFQVLKDADNYYVGQPICRASGWYKVPLAHFEDFKKYHNKFFKTMPIL